MFLSGLTQEKQKAFLNLAYTMIYADGRLDEAEKKIFDSFKAEIDEDFSNAQKIDFAEALAAFDDSSVTEKNGVFLELYAIALIDESYPEEEKVLVEQAKAHFNISDDKFAQMTAALKKFVDACKNLREAVAE